MTHDSVLYNLNIERAILSTIIFEPQLFEETASKLRSTDFYLPFHQHIFLAIEELTKEDKPIDEEFLKSKCKKLGFGFDEQAMLEIISSNSISNLQPYIEDLKEKSRKRELDRVALSIRKMVQEDRDSEELLLYLSDIVDGIGATDTLSKVQIDSISAKAPEFYLKNWLPIPKSTVTMLTAGGGTGKTWTALQIALRIKKEEPNSKIYLWLSEDPLGVIKDRMDAIKEKILFGEYSSSKDIVVSDDFPQPMVEIKGNSAKVNQNFFKLKRELREFDVIVLDPLLAFFGGDENSNSQTRVFMQPFLNWAKEQGKSIIFLHHSKKGAGDGEGRARGAGAIVDACRVVYDMEKYTIKKDGKNIPDPNKKGLVKFTLTKDNYGAGQHLESFVFGRKITPASTVVEVVYEEANPTALDMPIFN